eukprot:26910_1
MEPFDMNNTTYIDRINKILSIEETENLNNNNKFDIFDIICNLYSLNNNEGINVFILDYGKYVLNIDSNGLYKINNNNNYCNIIKCINIKREYRNKNI